VHGQHGPITRECWVKARDGSVILLFLQPWYSLTMVPGTRYNGGTSETRAWTNRIRTVRLLFPR